MKDADFIECKFIKEELRFLFPDDFYKDRFIIKRGYDKLSNNGKIFYKWFLYSNTHTNIYQKNCIWDFLNGDITSEELMKIIKKNISKHKAK